MLQFVLLVAVCFELAGSQQCMPVTDMPCESGWSDYTTCLAPAENMKQGIATYKEQVTQMGCEVPPWYWQATVDSKMMSYRAGLMQYLQSKNMSPMQTNMKVPKMKRRKRDVDYEDDSNYIYQPMNVNQVSAQCGFCARRIRCCMDFHQSWIDQNMQSDVCEEYSDACQVPPMEDGTCDYALAMPKLINDHINQVPGSNNVIGGRLDSRLQDKWMSLLGATEPTMYCTKSMSGSICNCCCGNYTAEPTEQGTMVCRRRRGPTGCGPNEVYQECSTSCQATCMEPNPSCNGEQCKTIYAGCKCKPGMVRWGVNCIQASQCPPNSGGGNQNAGSTTMTPASTTMMPESTTMSSGTTTVTPASTTMTPESTTTMTFGTTTMTPSSTTMTPESTTMTSGTTTVTPASTTMTPESTTTMTSGTTTTMSESTTTSKAANCMLSWSSPTQCTTACMYNVTVTAPDPNNSTSILLELTVVGPTDGSDFWTGIGWSPQGKMDGSDATLIVVISGVVSVQDRSMGNFVLYPLDANQNAFLMSGSMTGGVLNAKVGITCKQDDDPLNVCTDQFYPLYPKAPSPLSSGQPGFHTTIPEIGSAHSFANCF